MTHGGDNQDVWAIDEIKIRDVISTKLIKRNLHVKNFQTKLIYIQPGFVLNVRLESMNRKESKILFELDDVKFFLSIFV
jgi:hypothetical protein